MPRLRSSWPRSSRPPRVVTSILAGMSSRYWLGLGSAWAYISARGLCLGDSDDVGSGRDIAHPAGRRGADPRRGRPLAGEAHAVAAPESGPARSIVDRDVTGYLAFMPGPLPKNGVRALTDAERAAAYRERRKAE